MARRRVSEAEQARREAAAAAVEVEKLPRALVWEMGVFVGLHTEGSPHRHLCAAYADWVPARDRARSKWFADRGISTKYINADPRYAEALQDVEPLTVEEWIERYNEGKFNEYR